MSSLLTPFETLINYLFLTRLHSEDINLNCLGLGNTCIPDSYGYTCIDSLTVGGPSYVWENFSSLNYLVLNDNTLSGPVPLQFNFSFYDTAYDHIIISSNGK